MLPPYKALGHNGVPSLSEAALVMKLSGPAHFPTLYIVLSIPAVGPTVWAHSVACNPVPAQQTEGFQTSYQGKSGAQ